jgi:hypothetical protein
MIAGPMVGSRRIWNCPMGSCKRRRESLTAASLEVSTMFRIQLLTTLFFLLQAPMVRADPLAVVDLRSTTDWTYRRDKESDWTPIAMPNQLSVKGTKDRFIDYRRKLHVPRFADNQATTLKFLSVNDGGQVLINDQIVGSINYGLFPSEIDISKFVSPGNDVELTVRCCSRNHYYRAGAFPQDHNGDELLGMPRGVSLCVYPGVHVADVFVQPSVSHSTLGYDLRLVNSATVPRTVNIVASLTPWNHDAAWSYPMIADKEVTLPPNAETTVTQDNIQWTLGPDSYWWPNIPFREDYQAKLHYLNVTVEENGKTLDKLSERFGFAEHGEGPSYYTINGVRIFELQDGTQEHMWSANGHDGFQTSFEELEGWGSGPNGAAETWRKYLRLGINCFRLHNSAASEAMLNAADETGFMLVGESGIRGYAKPEEVWDDIFKPATVKAMARAYRSHPSVVRYSLDNEWAQATKVDDIARGLIDAAVSEDPTRPLSFSQDKAPWVKEFFGMDRSHHGWVLDHYHTPTTSPTTLSGIEEDYWKREGTDKNELIECARAAILDRMNGLAVFSPWTLNNYWCNFVAGGSKVNGTVNPLWRNKDRRDGIDGWGSDIVKFVQNCYSIYASADVDLIEHHLNTEALIFDPDKAVAFENQKQITRQMVVFNNSLARHVERIAWEVHLDHPTGDLAASGETDDCPLDPGEHASPSINFACPATAGHWRAIWFVIKTTVDGKIAFTEDRYFFKIKSTAGIGIAPVASQP